MDGPQLTIQPLTDQVESALLRWIVASGLQPGQMLPTELALSAHLGVSRGSLREALTRLRQLGLVQSRRRRGMVLAQPNPLIGFERICAVGLAPGALARELWDLRLLLEDALAERLFERCAVEDLVQLEAVVQDEAIDPFDTELTRRCDRAFHAQLYRVAAPPLAQRLLGHLAAYFELRLGEGRARLRETVDHAQLLDLLRTGNPTTFRRALRQHLDALAQLALAPRRIEAP